MIILCHLYIWQADEKASDRQKETKSEGTVTYKVYVTFFRAGAGILGFSIFMLFNVSSQVGEEIQWNLRMKTHLLHYFRLTYIYIYIGWLLKAGYSTDNTWDTQTLPSAAHNALDLIDLPTLELHKAMYYSFL